MSEIEPQLDLILADPLRQARAAGNALGYVGTDVPLDLLEATGRVACHLPWHTDRLTPLADQWLEASFPGLARSVLEDWAQGEFDCFGEVIFSRGEDSSQRLYYYVCELQRRGLLGGPTPLIFDIARIPRESSLRHTQSAVARLARELGVGPQQLDQGIERANATRRTHEALLAQSVLGGSLLAKLSRASLFQDISPLLRDPLPPPGPAAGRVLLAGSAPPDERLHRAVQSAGWRVAGEFNEYWLGRLGPLIEAATEEPAAAIGRHRHATSFAPRGFGDAVEALLVQARRHDVVVLWLTREDEALAWHVPAQREALKAAGIPALVLTARRWDAGDGATQEISEYLGALRG